MCWREKAKSALKREKIANVLQHLNVVKAVQNKLTYLKEERGAIFVLTALLLPIMFGCLGIAYDVGNVYIHKARLQNVTDAAALAGGRAYLESQKKTTGTKDNIDDDSDGHDSDNPFTYTIAGRSSRSSDGITYDSSRKHADADKAADDYIYNNIINLGETVHADKYSHYALKGVKKNPPHEGQEEDTYTEADEIFYRVGLYETVPLYFLSVITSKNVETVRAGSVVVVEPGGTVSVEGGLKIDTTNTFSMFDNLFTYSSSFYTERANTNDGTIYSSFTGDIVYTHLNSLSEDGTPSNSTFYEAQTDDGGTDTHQYNHLYQTTGVINDPQINTFYDTMAYMDAFRSKLGSPHIDVKAQEFYITGEETINNFCEYYISGKSERYRKAYPNDYYLLNENGDYYTVKIDDIEYKVCYHALPSSNILVRCAKRDKDTTYYLLNDSNQMISHNIVTEVIVHSQWYSETKETSDLTETQYKELGITYYNPWSDFQQRQNSGSTSNIYHIGRVTIDGQVQNIRIKINQALKGDENTPVYLIIDDEMEGIWVEVNTATTRRPVIVVYNGTKDVYFYVNGNEFKGTLYAPNAEVEINPGNKAKFFGNIIAHRIFMQASDNSNWVQTNYLKNDSDIQKVTAKIKSNIETAYNSLTDTDKNHLLDQLSNGLGVDKNNLTDMNWYNNLTFAEKKALYVKWKGIYDNETDAIKKDFLWLWNGMFKITEGDESSETTQETLRLINYRTEYQVNEDGTIPENKVLDPFIFETLAKPDSY